jgi:CHAT domain-containing protein
MVEDQPTREWMRELYRARFAENQETISAIRSASLSVLEHRRRTGASTHPHYWAAFVATGGWS